MTQPKTTHAKAAPPKTTHAKPAPPKTPQAKAAPQPKSVTEMIEHAVDQGATSVEEIHRKIAELPLSVLESAGLFERTAEEVRSIQSASIGAVYDVIRDVNHEVAKLAGELLSSARSKP